MPLILYQLETETRARVQLIHYMPDDPIEGLPEEIKAQGLRVENIPDPEYQVGKEPIMYVNPQTGQLWYEYVDRPPTKDEEIEQLKVQLAQAQADNLIALEAIAQLYETLIMQGGE